MEIEKYINKIYSLSPADSGFVYNIKKWDKLSCIHKEMVKDYEGKKIIRANVIDSYLSYYDHQCDVLKPFLLTMIWGFADTGYGTHRTNKYISSPENCARIKFAIDSVRNRDIEKAFENLSQIKGLGISYISKILHFASKGADIKDYSLIYDIRVARSLIKLTAPKEIAEIVTVKPSGSYESYVKYNSLIHSLAKKHHTEADKIELFLFEQKFEDE